MKINNQDFKLQQILINLSKSNLTANELKIFLFWLSQAKNFNPSLNFIAKEILMDRNNVNKILKSLIKKEVLTKIGRDKNNRNIYKLNPTILKKENKTATASLKNPKSFKKTTPKWAKENLKNLKILENEAAQLIKKIEADKYLTKKFKTNNGNLKALNYLKKSVFDCSFSAENNFQNFDFKIVNLIDAIISVHQKLENHTDYKSSVPWDLIYELYNKQKSKLKNFKKGEKNEKK